MFCTKCGAQISDGTRFCTACGAPVSAAASRSDAGAPAAGGADPTISMGSPQSVPGGTVQMPRPASYADPAPAGSPVQTYAPPQHQQAASFGEAPHRKASHKTRNVVIGVFVALVVLVAAAAAGWFFFIRTPAPTAVVFMIDAAGLDSSTGTRIPVHIEGEDVRGKEVSADYYLETDGSGMELVDGVYELTVAASPIAADGTIYNVADAGSATIEIEGDSGSMEGSISLDPIPAAEVTDRQIEDAYEAALAGGVDDEQRAEELRDAATARRDEAVEAEQEAQRRQEEEEARRREEEAAREQQGAYQADSFSFDIPSYWEGRVTVQVDGDSATIYSSTYPERELATLAYVSVDAGVGTDIGGAIDSTGDLGNGMMVYLYAPNYAYRIAYANLSGSTDPADYYTLEEAEELVDLQSGGTVNYTDYLNNMRDNGGTSPDQDMLLAGVQQIDIDDFNVHGR